MREEDLQSIERELRIRLPSNYREVVLRFPVHAYEGNDETDLWDDARRLVELNRELRAHPSHPWPPHLYAVGYRDGAKTAIDLRNPLGRVLWIEGTPKEPEVCELQQSFEEWVRQYVDDVRHDLLSDGIDADGTPEARRALEEAGVRQQGRFMLALVGGAVALLVLALLLLRLLH